MTKEFGKFREELARGKRRLVVLSLKKVPLICGQCTRKSRLDVPACVAWSAEALDLMILVAIDLPLQRTALDEFLPLVRFEMTNHQGRRQCPGFDDELVRAERRHVVAEKT
ncbi:hypothetical protein [Burkholderia glumae]|uniref:hypothetical protein n=1 Tax=Burkholderia glumae TaxID=337 RepID=UPI00215015A5|nr:hypothetical protein [Burkholderia glumae]